MQKHCKTSGFRHPTRLIKGVSVVRDTSELSFSGHEPESGENDREEHKDINILNIEARGLKVCFPWRFLANPECHLKRPEIPLGQKDYLPNFYSRRIILVIPCV